MKSKRVMKVLIVILAILLIFVLSRLYHFVIMSRVFDAIVAFKNEENRRYFVSTIINTNRILEKEVLVNQKIIKNLSNRNGINLNYEWRNLESNESYSFNVNSKEIYKNDVIIQNRAVLPNLPDFIGYAFKNNKVNLDKILDIYYIIPTKYEEKSCYKIGLKHEIIIIDKATYLPIYSSITRINSNDGNKEKIENIYEFKVGEVTDEDVALPDLSDYIIVE